jgi:flagellin
MAQVINSNVLSLTAQRNLNKSQSSLNTAIQRLSSGLRINSAKDDAAGLAITDRMTSQIRGLNQAVRNANDGISLAQTAEGALAESSNNLQRIRELAIQSANSTNSASDRDALNSEVQQLLSEIQRTATSTQFNGQNIIDGSFQASQFQVGANANQIINVSVSGATTNLLGAYQATSTAVTSSAFDGDSFTVNGVEVGVSVGTSAAGFDADSAAAKAVAINSKTSSTGVTATATNVLGDTSGETAAPVAGKGLSNGDLLINGIAVGAIAKDASAVTQGRNVADAINAVTSQTGVSAIADAATGALTLTATDGRNIEISAGNAGTVGVITDIYNATGLIANDTSATGGADTAPTGNHAEVFDIDASDGILAAGSGTAAPNEVEIGDTVIFDGVTYEFVEDADDVTGSNTAVVVTAAAGDQTDAVGAALAAAINGKDASETTVTAAYAAGELTLTQTLVGAYDITESVAGMTDAAVIASAGAAAGGTNAVGTDAATNRGTLTLSSSENFTLGGADLAFAGLASANPALTQLGTVDISTVSGANSAITVLDGALAQISSNRADLGAVQNRFESTMANLSTASENLSSARSRILDADFAAETANLTRAQILQQAGVAMVSQANALPQSVLSLLQ